MIQFKHVIMQQRFSGKQMLQEY